MNQTQIAKVKALKSELTRRMENNGWKVGAGRGLEAVYAERGSITMSVLHGGRIEVGRILEGGTHTIFLTQNNPSLMAGLKSALQFDYSFSIL